MKINWLKLHNIEYQIKDLEFVIYHIIFYGDFYEFSNLLIFLNQGYICKDCGEFFNYCECNKCKICDFELCLCNFKINYYDLHNIQDRNNLRKYLNIFIKYIFNQKIINNIKLKINNTLLKNQKIFSKKERKLLEHYFEN